MGSTPNKKQQAEMRSIKEPFAGLTIFVMNVERIQHARARLLESGWLVRAYGMIAIDESTTIKNHKAKRTKSFSRLQRFKYRRLLTGSPITKSPLTSMHRPSSFALVSWVTNLSTRFRLGMLSFKANHG